MENYKKRLYDNYITSGQAGSHAIIDPKVLFKPNESFIKRLIKKHFSSIPSNSKIVDVGCGHGTYVYFLQENNFTNVYGFDISIEQIELGHRLGIKSIENKSIDMFLKDNQDSVHVFLLMDILEHLTFDEIFSLLDDLYKKLNQGGRLVIHVPNAEGIFGSRVRYSDLTHETAFTPISINQLLSTIGFSTIKCFEDKPAVHGLKSLVRRVIWEIFSFFPRLLLIAETGSLNLVLSQNMTVIAIK